MSLRRVLNVVGLLQIFTGLSMLLAGGVSYTVGVVFYLLGEKGVSWAHGVWHLFVLAGSAIHYITILMHVL